MAETPGDSVAAQGSAPGRSVCMQPADVPLET